MIKDGVDPVLAHKLAPYTGMKGSIAERYVKLHPLLLTKEEALGITTVYRAQNVVTTAENFNHYVKILHPGSTLRFEDLPYRTKTAIASLRFQYGPNTNRTPVYSSLIASGKWQGAVDELRHFRDDTPKRRNLEADLIAADVRDGYLKP